jgi:hypothetical protein
MTSNAELVPVKIAEIRAEVIWMVFGAKAWCSLIGAALRKGNGVRSPYGISVFGHEGHHLAISRVVRLPIEWLAYHEERPCSAGAVPSGPWLGRFDPPLFQAE